jgi:hypothetical protein
LELSAVIWLIFGMAHMPTNYVGLSTTTREKVQSREGAFAIGIVSSLRLIFGTAYVATVHVSPMLADMTDKVSCIFHLSLGGN